MGHRCGYFWSFFMHLYKSYRIKENKTTVAFSYSQKTDDFFPIK